MSEEQLRISYREALLEAATRIDGVAEDCIEDGCLPDAKAWSQDAAALRALAALVAEAEEMSKQLNAGLDPLSSGEHASLDAIEKLIESLAAGFDPSIAMQPGGPTG